MDTRTEAPADLVQRLDLAARMAETPDLAVVIQTLPVDMRAVAWKTAREWYAATHKPHLSVVQGVRG